MLDGKVGVTGEQGKTEEGETETDSAGQLREEGPLGNECSEGVCS